MKQFQRQRSDFYRIQDSIMRWFFRTGGILALVLLIMIFWYLFVNAWNFLSHVSLRDFLFSANWYPTSFTHAEYGIFAMIVGTFMVTLGATLFAGTVGILGAIFLQEYFSPRVQNMVRSFVEIFSAIPSVVIGLIGITVLAPFLRNLFGWSNMFNGYTASLLVGIMALPTVLSIALDAIERVPPSIRIASLGLGATKWETIFKVILPSAKSGLLAALMLGIGRAIGETMIVLMIGGNSLQIPTGFADPVRTLTSTIAIEMGEVSHTSIHYSALFAVGLVLSIFTFVINYVVDRISHGGNK